MPRNPKVTALERARTVQANYLKAEAHRVRLMANRKAAMVKCVDAGATLVETGAVFGVSKSAVANVMAEARKGGS